MSTTRKILTATAVLVITGLLVLIVLAKVLVTPERIKSILLPRVEATLNRQVEVEQVDISLLSGIALKKLVVMEPQGEAAFLAAEQVTLRYRFWPLLSMRVEIDEIAIDGPQIRLERFADGSFNFSDLLRSAGQGAKAGREKLPAGEAEEAYGDGLQVLVSQLAIRQGTVQFIDRQGAGAPRNYRFENLALGVTQFSLAEDFPFRFTTNVNEAPLAMEGQANLFRQAAEAKVLLTGLDVIPFAPYFRHYVPGRLQNAKVDLDLHLSRRGAQLTSEGLVRVENLDLRLDALPQAALQDARLTVDYDLQFDTDQRRLVIEHGRLALNDIPLYVAGEIKQAPETVLDLNVRLNELDLGKTLAALPTALAKKWIPLQPAGLVTARLHLAGAAAQPKRLLRAGELRLDGVQVVVDDLRPTLTGLVTLKGDTLLTDRLVLVVGDNRLQLELEARQINQRPIVAVADVRGERLVVDQLLPPPGDRPAAAVSGAAAGPMSSAQPGPYDLPLRLSGTATIKQALYRGLLIDGLKARYRLEDNLLTFDELSGQVAGGSFHNTASIDLGRQGFAYRAQVTTSGVQADPLLSAFVPRAAGTVFGVLNLNLDLAGQGTEPAVMRQHLSGQGDLLMREGRLTGSGLGQGLADFLGLQELRVLGFDQAAGRFAIQDGRVGLASTLNSHDLRLAPRGDVGLDGTLNIDLDLRLSPDLTSRLGSSGRFAQLLVDADGWGQVPLKVKGSVNRPSFVLDHTVMEEAIKAKAKKKLQETLQEKLFGEQPPAGQADPKEQQKQLLEGVIEGLLGQ